MRNNFKFKAKIWRWPGGTPWHFVSLDQEISKEIRDKYPKVSMIKVEAIIIADDEVITNDVTIDNKSNKRVEIKWTTSLFRNNRDKNYLLPIKKGVRKKSGIQDGEVIDIEISFL